MPPIYDTYASISRLMAAGMPEAQAVAVVKEQLQLFGETFATKDDLKTLEGRLTSEFSAVESRITVKLGGLMIALATALAAVIKVF